MANRMKVGFVILAVLVFVGCSAVSRERASRSSRPDAADARPITLSSNPAVTDGPRIESPPTYQKGYKLTYRSRTSDFTVSYEGEDNGLLVFHYDTREKLPYDYLYTRDLKLAGITDAQQQNRFEPPVGYVDFPLFVGKTWQVSYKATTNSSHSMGHTAVEVMAFEPVQVPYGTVNAFRIRVRNSNREVARNNPYETYWFSPDIGYYVKHDTNKPIYEDPYELIAVSK
ncbi:MAG: hypothetical protein ACREQF_08015 [Candidatus Binataceae bacterium]